MSVNRRPLNFVQFTRPIVLKGTPVPVLTLEQGKRKSDWHSTYKLPGMWLDMGTREIWIGEDRFPVDGGLVAHYRYAKMATGKLPKDDFEAQGPSGSDA